MTISKARFITTWGLAGVLGVAGAGMLAKGAWDQGAAIHNLEASSRKMVKYTELKTTLDSIGRYPRSPAQIEQDNIKRIYLTQRLNDLAKDTEVERTLQEMSNLHLRGAKIGFTGIGLAACALCTLASLGYRSD